MLIKKKKITQVTRAHQDFTDLIKNIQAKKFIQQKKLVKSSRITLAIANQYKKYPLLWEELQGADLL